VLILQSIPWPNPNPQGLALKLAGNADSVEIKIYSKALVRVAGGRAEGPFSAGWVRVPLPMGWNNGLPNGVYYAVARPQRGAYLGNGPGPAVMMMLR
jgi:hypothetical protein